jgi:hypothetical protein
MGTARGVPGKRRACQPGLPYSRFRWSAALALGLAACAPGGAPGPEVVAADTASLTTLLGAVHAYVGEPSCTSTTECRAMALGAKPCGGPWTYLVYSYVTTDSAELARAVERYNELERQINTLEGRVSDCALVSAPELSCEEGRCVAVRDGTGQSW